MTYIHDCSQLLLPFHTEWTATHASSPLSASFASLVYSSGWWRRCMEHEEKGEEEGESMKPTVWVMISRESHSKGTRWLASRSHLVPPQTQTQVSSWLLVGWWELRLYSHISFFVLCYILSIIQGWNGLKSTAQTNSFASWILSQSFIFCFSARPLGGFNVLCPRTDPSADTGR